MRKGRKPDHIHSKVCTDAPRIHRDVLPFVSILFHWQITKGWESGRWEILICEIVILELNCLGNLNLKENSKILHLTPYLYSGVIPWVCILYIAEAYGVWVFPGSVKLQQSIFFLPWLSGCHHLQFIGFDLLKHIKRELLGSSSRLSIFSFFFLRMGIQG